KKGLILPDAATNTTNGVTLIKNDKAFALVTNQKPGFANQQAGQTGKEMYAIALTEPYTNTYQVNNFLWTISTNCEDPVSAMKMLNLMYTDADVANLLIWGIEGKHYVKTDVPNIIDYPAGVDSSNTGWGLNLGWEMGNQFLSYVWKGDSPDLMTELAAFNKSARVSKAMGFVFDSTSVKAEIAALTNVVNQYKLGLECGQSNPEETLPKFIADLKANGIDKVITEKQKQLDTYLANK
ncbi:MAG TPA: ABC transporter substrate-binding protein, partial [Clostridiales bacterium]|nr:ABC transporter substrate-binding protein [Clostridiales bacterium]